MDLQLEDKVALVSGSTAGIGFAIAKGLAREGARVIVNGRTTDRVNSAIERIRSHDASAKLEGIAADLGRAAGAEEAIRRFPNVEVLVNNLGIFEPKPFEQISDQDLVPVFRGERHERRTAESWLSSVDEETELGPNRFHFE